MRTSYIPKQTNQLSDYRKIKYFLQADILVLVAFPLELLSLSPEALHVSISCD
jgi:hypothetical protein